MEWKNAIFPAKNKFKATLTASKVTLPIFWDSEGVFTDITECGITTSLDS
jgi:hypothetical protein